MASIFTFDPDPPRVSSPWHVPPISVPKSPSKYGLSALHDVGPPPAALLVDYGITKLETEPQEGPTEYKLHLLLRPRRSFSASTTVEHVSGSHQSKVHVPRSEPELKVAKAKLSPASTPTNQSRQNRLQHLTTQLLWRLQQSSPYHSSSKADLVVPLLPESILEPSAPAPGDHCRPLPGIEGSQGALYEIGVSDDGIFVGLTKDELDESLQNLRAMASSLGCKVKVLRMVIVGTCQWIEEPQPNDSPGDRLHEDRLWVAEALVVPNLELRASTTHSASMVFSSLGHPVDESDFSGVDCKETMSRTEQLRVSLTGSTTSGKSSLLGTLSTSTLDNGRGKSRLSLLKHRHEISTGATSSVTPELIGYQDVSSDDSALGSRTDIVNYASGNVSSWNDIHSTAEPGRLVFLADSAGHPRYRRTTVRGLVSWAPHWTICCIAADDDEDATGKTGATASARDILGSAGVGVDLSRAHLELCLDLGLSLVIVITKLDLASKTGLRQLLAKVLSIIKRAGRQPAIMSTSSSNDQNPQLQSLTESEEHEVKKILTRLENSNADSIVPIILTSAVTGSGIGKIHALLRHLPIPHLGNFSALSPCTTQIDSPGTRILFQIDEVFAMPDAQVMSISSGRHASHGSILSGHLRHGVLSVGEQLMIGPFASESTDDGHDLSENDRASSFPRQKGIYTKAAVVTSSSHRQSPGDFTLGLSQVSDTTYGFPEWQKVHIVSLRNLRLPVRKLLHDQVGTVGVVVYRPGYMATHSIPLNVSRIRKGMVLMNAPKDLESGSLHSYRGFVAIFNESKAFSLFPGSLVIAYIASIRASAKVITVNRLAVHAPSEELFSFDESGSDFNGPELPPDLSGLKRIEINFQLTRTREWIELGSRVLIMRGGGPSSSIQLERGDKGNVGLDGLVGTISQVLL